MLGAALRMAAAESENAHRSSLSGATDIAAGNAAAMLRLSAEQRALAEQIENESTTVTVVSPTLEPRRAGARGRR